jgi:ATP-binding cassette, subfamily B, bacterial
MNLALAGKILNCARPYRWRFLVVLAQVFVLSGFELLKPWPLQIVIDNALGGKSFEFGHWAPLISEMSAWPPLVLIAAACVSLVAIYLATGALTVFYNWMAIGLGQRMVNDLRMRIYTHLQRLSLAFHGRQKVGDLMMRVTADTFAVQTMVMNGLLPILQAFILICGMVFILVPINLMLTFVSLSVVPVLAVPIRLFNRRIVSVATAARDADAHVYSVAHWGMVAIKHIQSFTTEAEEHRRFMQASGTALYANVYSAVISVLIAAGMGLVIFVGAREVLAGRLSLGQLLVFMAYVTQLYTPVNQIAQSWGLIAGSRVGAARCFEILETEQDLKDGARVFPAEGAKGRIEWRNIAFRYRSDMPLLRGIDLVVEPGQTIALVGATGAGKTTLLGLLARFFDPSQGQVLIDGIDLREYRLKSLRSQIAMVLQPPLVFPLSVRENIAYGREDATLESIKDVARLVGIDHMIEALPQGYDTIVDEAGAGFSEGEKQRIAIARALLRNVPILILDEPTSALDAETEAQIMQSLNKQTRGRTTFVIAHRLSTVRGADRILVLKRGVIAESGTFHELIRQNGAFARLYKTQFGAFEETHGEV